MTLELIDLVYISIISFTFIFIFFVQKIIDPLDYFGIGQIVYGSKSLTIKALLKKISIIFFLAIVFYLIGMNQNVVVFGIGLGSFLLVWPALLYPETVVWWAHGPMRLRKFLYLFYFLFIAISIALAFLAVLSVEITKDLIVGITPTQKTIMCWAITFLVNSIVLKAMQFLGKYIYKILDIKIT